MITYEAKAIHQGKYRLAESPCYDPRYERWSWVDIPEGILYTMTKDGFREALPFGHPIGAAVPLSRSRGFAVAGRDGLYLAERGEITQLCNLRKYYAVYQRSNDAKADPAGRLWFGSVTNDELHDPTGDLYCYERGEVRYMQKKTLLANGMAWSGDRKRFFFADSTAKTVYVYDYDLTSGRITNRQALFQISDGVPDGMCIDALDHLWVAVWGGGRVECRGSLRGELLAEVKVDAAHVSSCCFSGSALNKLFITTAGEGLEGAHDGCLFECPVNARGPAPDLVQI